MVLHRVAKGLARVVKDLHLTLARNEHAYYTLVSQVATTLGTKRRVPGKTATRIFAFGDSHSLPLAWREFTSKGKQYMVEPLLATGKVASRLGVYLSECSCRC